MSKAEITEKAVERKMAEYVSVFKGAMSGLRLGLGISERPQWRNHLKKLLNSREAKPLSLERFETKRPVQRIKERFSSTSSGKFRPLERFFPQPPSPEEIKILSEKEELLKKEAEAQKKIEAQKKKEAEDAEALRRANDEMAFDHI